MLFNDFKTSNEIFVKANVLGNDFILIKTSMPATDQLNSKLFAKNRLIELANSKFGLGADQILSLDPNFAVNIWNADGSIANMCGNGLRALAKWIFTDKENFDIHTNWINLNTVSGSVKIDYVEDKLYLSLPFVPKIKELDSVYYVDLGNLHKIHVVSMNPQNFENYASDKYNVSCIWLENETCHARTWELGAGETFACGSAAFSIAYVLQALGQTNLDVFFKYGRLNHIQQGEKIIQEGPANLICIGLFL